MSSFTVTGSLDRSPVEVVWTDGELSGDPDGVVRAEALVGEIVQATPTGPGYEGALRPAWVALVTILNALDADWLDVGAGVEVSGDVPAPPAEIDVPRDAVA